MMSVSRSARRARRRTRRRATAACAAGVVVVGLGGAAWAMTRNSGPTYRLAAATTTTVQRTVTTTGTIRTVDQASPAFAVAGLVTSVAVQVGSLVTAGQTLATLDRVALDQAVQSAQANVATAQQKLATDETAQVSSATPGATGATGSGANATTPRTPAAAPSPSAATSSPLTRASGSRSGSGTTTVTAAVAALRRAQAGVVRDQRRVDLDSDIAAADRSVAAERSTCSVILGLNAGAASSPASSNPAPGPTAPGANPSSSRSRTAQPNATFPHPVPSPSLSGTGDDLASCQRAIDQVQIDQAKVQSDVDGLITDEATLDRAAGALLQAASAASTGGSGPARESQGAPSGSVRATSAPPNVSAATGASANSRTGGSPNVGRGGAQGVITGATLAADQRSIDAANAELTVARSDTALATLTAPISGRVASVGLAVGQRVTPGSSTATVAILGGGQKSVAAAVGIADIDSVKVGTPATVTVPGVSAPLTGTVSYVGILNTSGTSGSTATYPVTILLAATPAKFYDGAAATVALHVGAAQNTLTVPTTALHHLGSLTTVDRYSGGTVTTTRVTIGIAGADRTQVLSGLRPGQQVVLATVSAPVPTTSINQRLVNRVGGAAGGLAGAGRIGGRQAGG